MAYIQIYKAIASDCECQDLSSSEQWVNDGKLGHWKDIRRCQRATGNLEQTILYSLHQYLYLLHKVLQHYELL